MTAQSVLAAEYVYRVPYDPAGTAIEQPPATGTLVASPSSLNLGNVPMASHVSQWVTVQNSGSAPVVLDSVEVTGNGFSGSHDCPAELAAGASCTVNVGLQPPAAMSYSGAVVVRGNGGQTVVQVPLSGTGVVGRLTASPASVTFAGPLQVGATAAYVDVNVRNDSVLTVHGISLGVVDASQAPSFAQSNNCAVALSPGQSCTVRVSFTPQVAGAANAVVAVESDAGLGTLLIPLQGVAQDPASDLTAATFEPTQVDATSTAAVTLKNTGVAPVVVGEVQLNSAAFSADPQACAGSLGVGQTCTVQVTFQPTQAGVQTASLSIVVAGAIKVVGLSAEAKAADVQLSTPAFAGTAIGQSSSATATLTNAGIGAVSLTSPSSGSVVGADFSFESTTCASSLAAGQSCEVVVRFQPTTAGERVAELKLETSAGAKVAVLTAPGLQVALGTSLGSVALAATNVGSSSDSQVVTLTNSGTLDATGLSLSVPAPFSVEASSCGANLGVGQSCSFKVRFTPVSTGSVSADLTISASNAPATLSVGVSSTGQQGVVSIAPAAVTFVAQQVASTSSTTLVNVSNSGTGPLTISSVGVFSGTEFAQSNNCATTLAPGASCLLNITFTPAASGTRTGSIGLVHNGADGASVIGLSGTGQVPSASLSDVDFGNAGVGEARTQLATLTNTGVGALSVVAPSAASVTGADFRFLSSTCATTVPAGQSCTVSIEFKPTASVARTGALTLSTGAGTLGASLSGAGQQPQLVMAPSAVTFGVVQTGATADSSTITLTNNGNQAASGLALTPPSGYTVTGSTCGTSLAVSASCTFSLRFAPTQAQAYNANLVVQPTGDTLPVSGSGQAPSASVADVDFGSVAVGGTVSREAILTNTGVGALSLSVPNASSVTGADFTFASTTCTASLPAGATCSVTVEFSPTSHVIRTGSVAFSTGAGAKVSTVAGLGQRAQLSLSSGSFAFGARQVGTSTLSSTFTLTNSGNLDASGVLLTPPSGYSLSNSTCTANLTAGSTCTFALQFSPSAATTYNGNFTAAATSAATATLALTGSGQAASATLTGAAFGSVQVGNNANLTATLTNTGLAPIAVTPPTGASVSGTDFSFVSTTCTATLSNVAGSNTCSTTVKFTPSAGAVRSGTLAISTGAGAKSASLSGTGLQGVLSANVSSLTFGATQVGRPSAAQTVVLTNSGTAPVTVSGLSVTTGAAVYGQTNTCGTPVAVNGSCSVSVLFTPQATGTATGSVTIAHDGQGGAAAISLTGTGQAPSATLTISPHGSAPVNSAVDRVAVLTNTGLDVISVTLPTSTSVGAAPFSLVETSCDGGLLAKNETCDITVRFSPTAATSSTSTLTVATEAGNKVVNLTGTGVASSLSFTPTAISSFGSQQVNVPTDSALVTLKNNGGLAATGLSLAASNTAFSILNSTCTTSLAAGASCTLNIRFNPGSSGYYSGSLTATASGSTASMPLTGTGVQASLTFLAPGADVTAWYGASATFNLTVTNSGSASVNLGATSVTGNTTELGLYAPSTTCGSSLAAGATCVIKGAFTPTTRGLRPSATYTLATSVGSFTAVVSNANGLQSYFKFTPGTTVAFGSQLVGSETLSTTITVTNSGGNSAVLNWAMPGGFSLVDNTCPASGTTYGGSLTCTFKLLFKPTNAIAYDGNLRLSWSGGQSLLLNMTGTGTALTGVVITGGTFGNADVGVAETRTFTMNNATASAITLGAPSVSGNTAEFAMASSGTTCTTSLAANSTCLYAVKFTPTARGARTNGSLDVVTSAGTRSYALTGVGALAALAITANKSLDFGQRQVGEVATQAYTTLTVTNSGDTTGSFSLPLPAGFMWYLNNCGSATLNASSTCTVAVMPNAQASSLGPMTGTLTATAGSATSNTLTATYTAVQPTGSMSSGAAGSVAVGSSKTYNVTLTNNGVYRVLLGAPTITGNTAEFVNAPGSTCTSTLNVGASCVLPVSFVPAAAGARTPATLTMNIGTDVNVTASLTGTGL